MDEPLHSCFTGTVALWEPFVGSDASDATLKVNHYFYVIIDKSIILLTTTEYAEKRRPIVMHCIHSFQNASRMDDM